MTNENAPFPGKLQIFSGTANLQLSQKIAEHIGQPLGKVKTERFYDGEIEVAYGESIRGNDIFIIQPTNQPDSNIFELLTMIYAARMASAGRITAVIPYYGYARSDRKATPRSAIIAKFIADLITRAGANRVLTMDLHAAQIQGFFDIPVDHLYAKTLLINFLVDKYKEDIENNNLLFVSPDIGAVKTNRSYAKRINNIPIAIIDKRRPEPNANEILTIIGVEQAKDKNVIEIDDLVDTGGTLAKGAVALIEAGAKRVDALCVHPVLSDPSTEILKNAPIANLFVTDTIAVPSQRMIDKIKIISVASLIAEAIREIHIHGSVSRLFTD